MNRVMLTLVYVRVVAFIEGYYEVERGGIGLWSAPR